MTTISPRTIDQNFPSLPLSGQGTSGSIDYEPKISPSSINSKSIVNKDRDNYLLVNGHWIHNQFLQSNGRFLAMDISKPLKTIITIDQVSMESSSLRIQIHLE